jgi:uncharacterized membrane protein YsdA (DUF1294 family)
MAGMNSPLILAAAASFACLNPSHHDGDNMRCSNVEGALRLQGIDAPEMPGACRPGRRCVAGDPYAARDALRAITAGRDVQCVQEDTDSYGRAIVNCTADGVNISCAMIDSGLAEPRYAPLDCSAAAPPPRVAAAPPEQRVPDEPPVIVPDDVPVHAPVHAAASGSGLLWPALLIGLLLINAVTWALFATDKRRATAGRSRERIAERTLLGWAALGGSPAAWHAIGQLRHKSSKDSFKQALLLISGLQIGALIGGLYWWLTG